MVEIQLRSIVLRGTESVVPEMGLAAQQKRPRQLSAKRRGGSTVEYAVMLGLVSIVSMGALTALGVKSKAVFEQVVTAMGPGAEAQPGGTTAPVSQTVSP